MIYLDMGIDASANLSELFLEVADTYRDLLEEVSLDALNDTVKSAGLRQKIKERSRRSDLFADPTTLLIYWLIKNRFGRFFRDWGRSDLRRDLEQIASDLGKSFPA